MLAHAVSSFFGFPFSAIVRQIPVGPLSCNMTIIADPKTKEAVLVDPGGDAEVSGVQRMR
jgi:hypothetical protein